MGLDDCRKKSIWADPGATPILKSDSYIRVSIPSKGKLTILLVKFEISLAFQSLKLKMQNTAKLR